MGGGDTEVIIEDENYVGERNEHGQKHGHGKFTYENGKTLIFKYMCCAVL